MTSTEIVGKKYTREEAAVRLGLSLATFDRRRYAGEIEEYRASPHKILFTEEALMRYEDEHTVRASYKPVRQRELA